MHAGDTWGGMVNGQLLLRRCWKICALMIVVMGMAVVGCATHDQAVRDTDPPIETWGEPFRSPGVPGQSFGIDKRARQIERSLGVR